jgi:ACS family hexuronate transporter-like MFS transporter
MTPLMIVPVALAYGWRTAFLLTGVLGVAWMVLWFAIARPPYLPAVEQKPQKLGAPNLLERRFWALVFSYALPVISGGPIITIFPLYLSRGLGVSQAELGGLLWMPPAAWGLGYFFWGWATDRYAPTNRRPIEMFLLLTALSATFGLAPYAGSVAVTMALMSLSIFACGGFQMVALKVGSFAYPREQAALMTGIASGSWSLVNALVAPVIGWLFDQERWAEAFWLVALLPTVGIAVWALLTRDQSSAVQSGFQRLA